MTILRKIVENNETVTITSIKGSSFKFAKLSNEYISYRETDSQKNIAGEKD